MLKEMDLNLEFLEFQSFTTAKKLRHEMQNEWIACISPNQYVG